MEHEVADVAKLGVVLIALATLINIGFGVFQISKGTANTGVNNLQEELENIQNAKYSTYDQTEITGQMLRAIFSQFKGEEIAILISNQAWIDCVSSTDVLQTPNPVTYISQDTFGSGIFNMYNFEDNGITLPIVYAYNDKGLTREYKMNSSTNSRVNGSFINYGSILGRRSELLDGSPVEYGLTEATCKIYGIEYNMAGIYFDYTCFICNSGFATDEASRIQHNDIIKNIQQTGTTEYIPTGAKFDSYLVKDSSGTIIGIACMQVSK